MRIKLDNVSKYYYSSNAVVPALRKIKLEFDIGEFVAITGESGSGKSTLLNIISGLDSYDDGEFYVNDEPTSYYDAADWDDYRKNKIGFVFQNYNLIEHYSVLNNVESALLIQGCSAKEAKNTAKELLARVGLGRQLHQRASKLSSGQKQRLSIARALAKNTDIIIADEPTGNLDSENGRQIMELLSKLSRDKLIITVTHNYEEASPYVTRKVRLHDGEVVSDIHVDQAEDVKTAEDGMPAEKPVSGNDAKESSLKPAQRNRKVKSDRKTAWRFTLLNITTQPGRGLFFTLFLLLTAAVSFVFLGEIYSNWDDIFSRDYNPEFFSNSDEKRIVVKKPDGGDITQQDIDKFNKIKYVEMADLYDYSNDINYYFTEGKDYEYIYRANDDPRNHARLKTVSFIDWTNFVKSSSCIAEEDLSAGRLPEARNEVVIYSSDPKALGTEQDCYFAGVRRWGYNEYYTTKVKIVGLLKKESNQVFFSKELCNMISLPMYEDYYLLAANKNALTNAYTTNITFYPVIGEGLKYGELRVSTDLAGASDSDIAGEAVVEAHIKDAGTSRYDAVILDDYNSNSIRVIEMSEDWFYELYRHESKQASLYLKDYVYTDYVLRRLRGMGYEAISSFRISAGNYNHNRLAERNSTIFMSMIVLLLVGILEILILRSILKIRNKDFDVLGSIGMSHRTIKMMNFFELYLYLAFAVIIVIIAANTAGLFKFAYLANMIKYYNAFAYSIYVILNLAVISVTVALFNRYLKHRQRWS